MKLLHAILCGVVVCQFSQAPIPYFFSPGLPSDPYRSTQSASDPYRSGPASQLGYSIAFPTLTSTASFLSAPASGSVSFAPASLPASQSVATSYNAGVVTTTPYQMVDPYRSSSSPDPYPSPTPALALPYQQSSLPYQSMPYAATASSAPTPAALPYQQSVPYQSPQSSVPYQSLPYGVGASTTATDTSFYRPYISLPLSDPNLRSLALPADYGQPQSQARRRAPYSAPQQTLFQPVGQSSAAQAQPFLPLSAQTQSQSLPYQPQTLPYSAPSQSSPSPQPQPFMPYSQTQPPTAEQRTPQAPTPQQPRVPEAPTAGFPYSATSPEFVATRVLIPTERARNTTLLANASMCLNCVCTYSAYCCRDWASYCDGITVNICRPLCNGSSATIPPMLQYVRSTRGVLASEGEFCGGGLFLRPLACSSGFDCLSNSNQPAQQRGVGTCVRNSVPQAAVSDDACTDATPRCRCTPDRCPGRGWSGRQSACLLGESTVVGSMMPCQMTPQTCEAQRNPCACGFGSCLAWTSSSPRQCTRAPSILQCGRTLQGMADSIVARFHQRGIDVLCWDFDNTIVFLDTPQGTYPNISYILERVNPDFVLLAKTAQKAGMHQAITTFNEYGMLYIDGLPAGGARLMQGVLEAIFGNNSGFLVAAFNPRDHEKEGKLNHLQAVSDRLGITKKSSVMLIDDSKPNVDLAKQQGWSAVRATTGRGFELRILLSANS